MPFRLSSRVLVATLCLLAVPTAQATNGMNLIGVNARSSGLAGADVALGTHCPGCNPATLGGDGPRTLSAGISFLHPPVQLKNTVSIPNDITSDDHIYVAPYFDYAQRPNKNSPWMFGINIRAQGGLGTDYKGVRTFAGTFDEAMTDLQLARISPTAAYRVNDRLRLGAAVQYTSANLNLKLFPNTYSPGFDGTPGTPDDFLGLRVDDLPGDGYAGRVGLHYQANERLSLALSYTSRTDLDFDDGDLTLNLGMARVTYDAELDDFGAPAELEAGFAYQATPKLLVVADAKWIEWSEVADVATVKGANPNLPVPLTSPMLPLQLKWDDQWVYAIGVEYALQPGHTLRAGFNHGSSPVDDAFVLPLFPVTVEDHVTVGYSLELDSVTLDLAWERSIERSQTNPNPDPRVNPFGPGSETVTQPGNVLHVGLNWRF